MYNFGSFEGFIVKPTILPEICSTIPNVPCNHNMELVCIKKYILVSE